MAEPRKGEDRRVRGGWGSLAAVIGAIFLGSRDQDERALKRVKWFVGWLAGGGFAIYIAIQLLGVVTDGIKNERTDHRTQISTLVEALNKQATSIDNLAGEIRQSSVHETERYNALLHELAGKPRPPASVTIQPAPGTTPPLRLK